MTDGTFLLVMAGAVIIAGYLVFKFLIHLCGKPVPEITLTPLDNPRWSDVRKVAGLIDSFVRNGFEAAGSYSCREIPSLIVSGFTRPSEQITGVVYDHPTLGIWADVYVHYTDGGSLTVSNAPGGQELDHMPDQTKMYCRESSVDELLKTLSAESKKTGRIAVTKEEFPSRFEDHYQKEMQWRIDRGGPTSSEIMRVAHAMGEAVDSERLHHATQKIKKTWMSANANPKGIKRGQHELVLPKDFARPETFRRNMEQRSAPIPQLNVPALPVYLVFIAALAYWCYYGYRYNDSHFPVSLTELVVFFSVFLVLFVAMMAFREYHRRVRMCPLLKRVAAQRPGAFLVIHGSSPSLCYARDTWVGEVSFREGGEHENAFTRLDAVTKHSMGSLTISRSSVLNKVIGWSDKETIPLPENEFSRKFTVSGTDTAYAKKLLCPVISDAVMRLEECGRPFVKITGNLVGVEVDKDLSRPRKEAVLRRFLEEAEKIVEAAVQQAGGP